MSDINTLPELFLSWSGERSRQLADALERWIPQVLPRVKTYHSATAQPGVRWHIDLARKLEASQFAILCITQDNVLSPWLHFEAGAVACAYSRNSVIPLLLDVGFDSLPADLAQFQGIQVESGSMLSLLEVINEAQPKSVSKAAILARHEAAWSSFWRDIESIPASDIERTWLYAIRSSIEGRGNQNLGWFDVLREKAGTLCFIHNGRAYWKDRNRLSLRGNWHSDLMIQPQTTLQCRFHMHTPRTPTLREGPTDHQGFIHLERTKQLPIAEMPFWEGFFQDFFERRNAFGSIVAVPTTTILTQHQCEELLDKHGAELLDRCPPP